MRYEVEQEAIRALIRESLDLLQSKNPSYSLRAFANRLKTAPATISAVLRGRRSLSVRRAERLLERLPVDAARKESALFLLKNKRGGDANAADSLPYRVLSPQEARLLFRFPNIATLALAETIGFESSPSYVATRLNISAAAAKRSLKELLKLGFLVTDESGRLKTSGGAFIVPDELRQTIAMADFLRTSKQMKMASPQKSRNQVFATTVFALDPKQIGLMQAMIRDSIVQVAMLGGSGAQKEVFQISTQLVPLSVPRRPTK